MNRKYWIRNEISSDSDDRTIEILLNAIFLLFVYIVVRCSIWGICELWNYIVNIFYEGL